MEANIGQKIRNLRELAGLTMESLAEKAGLSMDHLGRIERGDSQNPGILTLGKIAAALGIDVKDLLNAA